MPLDLENVMKQSDKRGGSVGRPVVARAMVAAGYVASTNDAFGLWLGTGCPAFVPRTGAPVAEVITIVHAAGGLASLAHPGRTRIDDRIAEFAAAGLDALEVYHSDHDATSVDTYRRLALDLGLLMTGGSDFHGEPAHGVNPGDARLPEDEWHRLRDARARHARS
jgi:predicted metal-dependent phosphoesterase TrpH